MSVVDHPHGVVRGGPQLEEKKTHNPFGVI